MDLAALLTLLSNASVPTTIVGGVIFLFFYLKKQETELRAELSANLKRLQEDKVSLYARITDLEDDGNEREGTIDNLRRQLRQSEDDAIFHRRRADRAESLLEIAERSASGRQ